MKIEKPIGFSLYDKTPGYLFNNEELFKELESTEDDTEKSIITEKLVQNNTRLIFHIVKSRFGTAREVCERLRMTQEELFSMGTFGLLKAIQSFSLDKKIKFATYAGTVINNEISMFLRKDGKRFEDASGDEEHGDSGNTVTIFDSVPNEVDSFSLFVEDSNTSDFLLKLRKALNERELKILTMHFYEGKGQKEMGIELGLSQTYVCRLKQSMLLKARKIYEKMEES